MRWRFLDPNNADEAACRTEMLRRIDRWWGAFRKKAPQIDALFRGQAKWDLPAWMGETLQAIDETIMWEFGPALHTDGRRLVITPESEKRLRPLVGTLLERAPSIPGWECDQLPDRPCCEW